MMNIIEHASQQDRRPKWYDSPATLFCCRLSDVFLHLPDHERRTLALSDNEGKQSYVNARLDTIVRKPFGDDPNYVPVGVVSKNYRLVPHKDVLDAAVGALREANINTEDDENSSRRGKLRRKDKGTAPGLGSSPIPLMGPKEPFVELSKRGSVDP